MNDVTSNQNLSEIGHILTTAEIPSYVKDASFSTVAGGPEPVENGYALRVDGKHRFPCHNKAACFVSRLFFEQQRNTLAPELVGKLEKKIANFELIHGIEHDEVRPSIALIQKLASTENLQQKTNRVVNRYNSQPDSAKPSEWIAAAREMKQAGISNSFVDTWALLQPRKDLAKKLAAVCVNHKSHELLDLTRKLSQTSSSNQPLMIGDVADALFDTLGSNRKVASYLHSVPEDPAPPVRLVGQDIDRELLEPKLAQITYATGVQLVSKVANIPKPNWVTVLEGAPSDVQRKVVDLVS